MAAYAAREAENEDPEETKRQEEAAAKRLAEKVNAQKKARQNGATGNTVSSEWEDGFEESQAFSQPSLHNGDKGKEVNNGQVKKLRGIPTNVRLFEVFWQQVVELIKVCFISGFRSTLT